MTNLRWLRSRIWIALAAGGCGGKDAAPPRPPYAGPQVPWTLLDAGCGGETWCALPVHAARWASTDEHDGACPKQIVAPDGASTDVPGGTYEMWVEDGQCCVETAPEESCEGRPFRDGDRAVVAAADPRGDRWIAAALAEHASIASFARAALELLAVGAPPALIAGCMRAALDEIAHAQGCLALASRRVEPGPIEALAPRGGGLAAVARDTFVEGCVGETIGALRAANARDAATDPAERALLARIADDEARHAELAWQTVAWAIGQAPEVAADVRAAADRARTASPVWRDVIDPALEAMIGLSARGRAGASKITGLAQGVVVA